MEGQGRGNTGFKILALILQLQFFPQNATEENRLCLLFSLFFKYPISFNTDFDLFFCWVILIVLITLPLLYWVLKAARDNYPCVGQSFHGMTGFLWLHLSGTVKIACEPQGQSPAGLTSGLPQFHFCGFRESVRYFLCHRRAESYFWSPGSAVHCLSSGEMLLGTPVIVCCFIFMHKCQWLKKTFQCLAEISVSN